MSGCSACVDVSEGDGCPEEGGGTLHGRRESQSAGQVAEPEGQVQHPEHTHHQRQKPHHVHLRQGEATWGEQGDLL